MSVDFPAVPTEKQISCNNVLVTETAGGYRCLTMVKDFEKFGMDSAGLAVETSWPRAFSQFRDGIIMLGH